MYELTLTIADSEGALLRVLGTIERRGFRLGAMSTATDDDVIRATISVASDGRAVEVLLRQLKRLVDVREAAFEKPRPAFRLPRRAAVAATVPARRGGLSWLGIPERVSGDEVFA